VARPELPSFDLVLATVGRTSELARFLGSLEAQTHYGFRVLLVDQNEDERVEPVLAAHRGLDVVHLRSERGLSRARNRALPELGSDLVAFPDDDCLYPADLLERVAATLAAAPELGGVTGRSVDASGVSGSSWKRDPALLTDTNLWNRAISYTIFLRREVVERVGPFDEELGLGSGTAWSAGEETEYLVRAVRAGLRVAYDPTLTVRHDPHVLSPSERTERGHRDGAALGYILGKHRYPKREVARRLFRPAGGALLALVGRDSAAARFHAATLRGRIAGLRAVRAS
jgi:GT2 family glycosyltransferase